MLQLSTKAVVSPIKVPCDVTVIFLPCIFWVKLVCLLMRPADTLGCIALWSQHLAMCGQIDFLWWFRGIWVNWYNHSIVKLQTSFQRKRFYSTFSIDICQPVSLLDFGSEREFSAPGKCVSVKRPRAKSTQVDRSVAGLPLPPPTPPMHGFWRFEHVCLHAKQNPTVRVHTGSGERETGEGERGMERERGESARGIGGDFILGKRFFLSVRVCGCSSWVWSKVSLIVLSLSLFPSRFRPRSSGSFSRARTFFMLACALWHRRIRRRRDRSRHTPDILDDSWSKVPKISTKTTKNIFRVASVKIHPIWSWSECSSVIQSVFVTSVVCGRSWLNWEQFWQEVWFPKQQQQVLKNEQCKFEFVMIRVGAIVA